MMVQTLKNSFNRHLWYEHVLVQADKHKKDDIGEWVLREGPMYLKTVMAEKKLTFEDDRAKVLFLERQTKLLGRAT